MTKTRAILLDLDRTLVDVQSFTDYAAALTSVSDETVTDGGTQLPTTDWDHPTHACMSLLVARAGDDSWQSTSDNIAHFERLAIPDSQSMPTLHEAMRAWSGAQVAVVTLLPADIAAEVLAAHGIEIPVIMGRDPHMRPKPHGDGLLAACRRLGVDPVHATMIGDASWDYAAARDAGCAFIGVPFSDGVFGPDVLIASDLYSAVLRVLAGD